jgi:hypothetical protein
MVGELRIPQTTYSADYAVGEEERISELFCADRCRGQSERTLRAPAEGISRSSSTSFLRRGIAATQPRARGSGNTNLPYEWPADSDCPITLLRCVDCWEQGRDSCAIRRWFCDRHAAGGTLPDRAKSKGGRDEKLNNRTCRANRERPEPDFRR